MKGSLIALLILIFSSSCRSSKYVFLNDDLKLTEFSFIHSDTSFYRASFVIVNNSDNEYFIKIDKLEFMTSMKRSLKRANKVLSYPCSEVQSIRGLTDKFFDRRDTIYTDTFVADSVHDNSIVVRRKKTILDPVVIAYSNDNRILCNIIFPKTITRKNDDCLISFYVTDSAGKSTYELIRADFKFK